MANGFSFDLRFFYFFIFSFSIFCLDSDSKYNYKKILNHAYKSDIDLIFERGFSLQKSLSMNISYKKFFHKFYETEFNLMNGAQMKCYFPSKLKPFLDKEVKQREHMIEVISDDWASLFMREVTKLCYNSNFDNWFYKLCPMKNAVQVLTYKKKDEKTGEEYTEIFTLGVKANWTEKNPLEVYQKEGNASSPLLSLDKTKPFVMVDKRLAKIFNYDLSLLNKYEVNLVIDYNISEVNNTNNLVISKYIKSVDEYLSKHPGATSVPLERRILKQINKHLVLLDSPFPYPKVQYPVNLNTIKVKAHSDIEHAFSLTVYGDYIYCLRCEFATFYSIGDSIFIKNGRFSEAMRTTFTESFYKSRRIVRIVDNQLMQVEKPFPSDFLGTVFKGNYFVMCSHNKTVRWKNGSGSIKIVGDIIFGKNSNFIQEIAPSDRLIFTTPKVASQSISTNPRVVVTPDCVVRKVISNNILLTTSACKKPIVGSKSDYFIAKKFYGHNVDQENFNKLADEPMFTHIIDFHTLENFSINKLDSQYYNSNYFFHPGFLLTNEMETVFRFELEKIVPKLAYARILFGTKIENFSKKSYDPASDYELLIQSDSGAMIKKIENDDHIEFIEKEIRSLFQQAIEIEIIIKNGTIYLSSFDDDRESSIKVRFQMPSEDKLKYIYFDMQASENILVKDMRKINFIEQRHLVDIFIFERKYYLSPTASYREVFTNGDPCPAANKNRSATIEYRCDTSGTNDILIEKVEEPSMCEYSYHVKTKHLCSPEVLMRNKIENSIAKVKCAVQNNKYNEDSEAYFKTN